MSDRVDILLTPEEAAERCGCPVKDINECMNDGSLPCYKYDRKKGPKIKLSELLAFMKRNHIKEPDRVSSPS